MIIYVNAVGENLKLKHMSCGSVGLLKTFGQDARLDSRRCQAATVMSLSSLRLCSTNLSPQRLSYFLSKLGSYGAREIRSYMEEALGIQNGSTKELATT